MEACPLSASQRTKGAAGELEVVHLLREYGWPNASRTSDGRHQSLRGDIAHGPAGVHLEIKRRETVSVVKWWEQANAEADRLCVPVVAFRRSRMPWLACLELDELLPLLRLRERG